MVMLTSEAERAAFGHYLTRWYCQKEELASICGVSVNHLSELIEQRAVPGAIYRLDREGHVWSALAAYLEQAEGELSTGTATWFARSSSRWIRQAVLLQRHGEADPAAALKRRFNEAYALEVAGAPDGLLNFVKDIEPAEEAWDAWIQGAYAVCMRHFSARALVEKHGRQSRAKMLLARGVADLSPEQRLVLHDDIERLVEILTPFSPFERAGGTPGTVVDRALAELALGSENPFIRGCAPI